MVELCANGSGSGFFGRLTSPPQELGIPDQHMQASIGRQK